ncbi:hypothetical protein LIBAT_07745 [Leptospira interrogans]
MILSKILSNKRTEIAALIGTWRPCSKAIGAL